MHTPVLHRQNYALFPHRSHVYVWWNSWKKGGKSEEQERVYLKKFKLDSSSSHSYGNMFELWERGKYESSLELFAILNVQVLHQVGRKKSCSDVCRGENCDYFCKYLSSSRASFLSSWLYPLSIQSCTYVFTFISNFLPFPCQSPSHSFVTILHVQSVLVLSQTLYSQR